MKYLRMEPAYKKSVIEDTYFQYDINGGHRDGGNTVWVTMETGWRWGTWLVSVPETEEEIIEFANSKIGGDANGDPYYKNLQEVYDDYCCDESEESDEQVIELIDNFTPSTSESCDFHEIEDYDAEMLETWDGCWCDFSVRQGCSEGDDEHLSEEELEAFRENVEEAWNEDGYEGIENLDFMETGCEINIHCPVTLTPCDENGNVSVDAA